MEGRADDENEEPIDLSSARRAAPAANDDERMVAGNAVNTDGPAKEDKKKETNRRPQVVDHDEREKMQRKKRKQDEPPRTSPSRQLKRAGYKGKSGVEERRRIRDYEEEKEEEEEEEKDKSTWPPVSPITVFLAHLAACTSSMPDDKMRVVMTTLETQLRFMFRAETDATDTGIVLATRLLPYIVDRVNSVQFANAGSLQLNYLTKRVADRNVAASLNLSSTNLGQRVRAYSSRMNVVGDARINTSHNFERLGGVRRVFETYNNFYTGSTVFTVRPRKSLREELLEPGAQRFFDPHAPPSSFFDADAPYYVRRQTLREGRGAPSTNVPIGGATGAGGAVLMDTSLVF